MSLVPAPDQLVKLLFQDMCHRGYQWHMGRNDHPAPEPFQKGCHEGSFYITKWRDAMNWISLNGNDCYWIADAEPHGPVFSSIRKLQTHSVTLTNLRKLVDVIAACDVEPLFEQSPCVIKFIPRPTQDQQLAAVRARGRAIAYTARNRKLQVAAVVQSVHAYDSINKPDEDLADVVSHLYQSGIQYVNRKKQTAAMMHRGAMQDVTNVAFMPSAPADYWRAYVSSGHAFRTRARVHMSAWQFTKADLIRIAQGWPGMVEYVPDHLLSEEIEEAANQAAEAGRPTKLMDRSELIDWTYNLEATVPEYELPLDVRTEISFQRARKRVRIARIDPNSDWYELPMGLITGVNRIVMKVHRGPGLNRIGCPDPDNLAGWSELPMGLIKGDRHMMNFRGLGDLNDMP